MVEERDTGARATVAFLLVPRFSILPFTSAVEPLRAANRLSSQPLYRWFVVTRDGLPVRSSSDIEIVPNHDIDSAPDCDLVTVVAGMGAETYQDKKVFGWLRRRAREGAEIAALSTASYILARAGLLDGRRCTVHWENLAAFQEEFPELDVTDELFEVDRGRMTCSGGTAALDLMLTRIAVTHGRRLANLVAEQFIHERIRDNHDQQRMDLRNRLGISHPRLLQVIELMEANIESPLPRATLARRTGVSTRQLERLFRKYLARTPTQYYLELRLARARNLLLQTSMSVLDVALACGFVSASHFSKCYRECFKKTPREDRSGQS